MINVSEQSIKSHVVCDKIKQMINSGRIKPGDRILSQRRFAGELDVSVDVMRNAFKLLEKEELIVRRHGSGTFVNPDFKLDASVLAGVVTSYHREDITDYFEPLFELSATTEITPMICTVDLESNWMQNMRNLVGHKPDFLLLDLMDVHKYVEVKPLIQDVPHLFVHHWSWPERQPEPGIYVDYVGSYIDAIRALQAKGNERILFVMGSRMSEYSKDIFRQVEEQADIKLNRDLFVVSSDAFEQNPELLRDTWEGKRITAAFGRADYETYRFMMVFDKLFPGQAETVDKIGFYDQHWSRQLNMEFSSMRVDFEYIWKTAFDMAAQGDFSVKYVKAQLITR